MYLILTLTFDRDGVRYRSGIFEGSKWRSGDQGSGHILKDIILRAHTLISIIADRMKLEFPAMTVFQLRSTFQGPRREHKKFRPCIQLRNRNVQLPAKPITSPDSRSSKTHVPRTPQATFRLHMLPYLS